MSETSWRMWREPDHVDLSDRRPVAADLARHMRDFLAHKDVSPALVGHIEGLLDVFEDTDWHGELDIAVALYEPWGGSTDDQLITAQELGRLFEWALPFVDEEAVRA